MSSIAPEHIELQAATVKQAACAQMPPTRYQGSKRKLSDWIRSIVAPLDFHTALDAFGGTGSVAYMLKAMGKQVTFNDLLPSNGQTGMALIENDNVTLSANTVENLLAGGNESPAPDFIFQTFGGIYFTDAENRWLDRMCARIPRMDDRYERAIAWHALFQSAIIKRPYNLFHRKNLYMRLADVQRSFGNKRTWDRPFDEHFRALVAQANRAVFSGEASCLAICSNAVDVSGSFDLVYIDPPYLSAKGVGVDYGRFYHFLDGMLDYDNWSNRIDWSSKHRRLLAAPSEWCDAKRISAAFDNMFDRFCDSVLVVSYRSDGIPSVDDLRSALAHHGKCVAVHEYQRYQYALSTNRKSKEVLLVAM